MRRYLPFLIIAAVLLAAVGAGLMLYRYRAEPEPAPPSPTPVATPSPSTPGPIASATPQPTMTQGATSTPAVPSSTPTPPSAGPTFTYGTPGAEPPHVRGDTNAPVVLEEFGDFQCLPCSLLFPLLEKLERDYGQRLCVVFREHPLRIHRYALDAARAAEAAGLQGRFWEMHDALYRNRALWIPGPYIRPYFNDYAAELKLDVDRFKTDMDGYDVGKRIVADQERGDSLGIDRTPVVFVNGVKVPVTEHNEKGLRAAIDRALAAKGQ